MTLPGITPPGSTLPGTTLPGTTPPGTPPPTTTPPGVPPGGGTTGPPSGGLPGKVVNDSFTNAAGTRKYQVYVPSTYKAGTALPLVVALHGCTEQIDVFRQLTALDKLAESKGFIVVFPGQTPSANQQNCWNWFTQPNMQRGSGEASIIAGITQAIQQRYSADTKRTYVLGFSAGGAMATVMGATYPDLYAAVGSGSGCEYNGLPCVGSPGPDPVTAGRAAYQAMGSHARPMPVIAFQGDADTTVVPANGDRIVREWQVTNDWADDGSNNGSVPLAPTSAANKQVAGGRSYTVTTYGDGHGGELIQYWVVHGMNHAWSGGCGCEPYADPSGPNESQAMVDFFLRHTLP
ncbi:MAG TPA: PHB depolymerase family esterase [Gaiellaceae bacterium]|nr:PHB depolymerase family esterase [Gaiellaceae bacterium]